ncbi:MAG: recombinase family protein [Caulobacterales bacterium]|nr:recombinase family protein [Caulobacterales bacterium]MCA0372167.1 recombinase family protein [Pseudomonadota bacterium]
MKIGYARVSTAEQNNDLQIDALQKEGCDKIFEEKASGAQRDRPELKSALGYARAGDTIVVWKLDRLARSLKQLIETVEDLEKHGIGFKSITESIDTSTSGGKLIFHIFASLAEFERNIIRERTKAGLESAKARGRTGGRPSKMSEDDIEVAKTLLKNPDITAKEVARRMGVSFATLYRYLPKARSL